MGWFKDKLKAVGRMCGDGLAAVGRFVGSQTMEMIGEGITDMCTVVDKTAKRTSEMDSYDRESARISETQRINKILSEFSLNLQERADDIEDIAIRESQVYFSELITNMKNLNLQGDIKINTNKIHRELNKVNRDIRGSFKHYLAKRVSIDDAECLNILKMETGSLKENAMKKFGNKVLKEARENLCIDIKDALIEQQEYITEEINDKMDDVILNLKNLNSKVTEFEKLKQTDEKKIENEKMSCINKIQSIECILDILA